MSNIAKLETNAPPSIINAMAARFTMEPRRFEQTLRATVFPKDGSPEQFAAFLLVARQYDLNPITKEIYAFPGKGGGIVPIVSIDGWLKLINSHPQFDGMEFEDTHADGELVSVTCKLWRKDRSKPVVLTEYLAECSRQTEPWKMKHRMLRHKTLIQCARYAFGFAGVYDPDEGERIVIAQGGDVSQALPPRAMPTPPAPPPAPHAALSPPRQDAALEPPKATEGAFEFDHFCEAFRAELRGMGHTLDESNRVYQRFVDGAKSLTEEQIEELDSILREHAARFWTPEE